MLISPNLDIAGTVPKGRVVLTVGEVANRWQVTASHVIDLIEEGQLVAFDASGRLDFFPCPVAAVQQLAVRLKITPGQLMEFIHNVRPAAKQRSRSLWRVPVVEGYVAFMRRRHSLCLERN